MKLELAIKALPGYPEISSEEIIQAAKAGDRNAQLVINESRVGNPFAMEWFFVDREYYDIFADGF